MQSSHSDISLCHTDQCTRDWLTSTIENESLSASGGRPEAKIQHNGLRDHEVDLSFILSESFLAHSYIGAHGGSQSYDISSFAIADL